MLLSIYNDNLKYFAWSKYGKEIGDNIAGDTVVYFLEKYEHYKNHAHKHLEANTVLKARSLYIDLVRKENSKSLLGEITDPGGAEEHLEEGWRLPIKEIKEINEELKKSNEQEIKYKSIVVNVSLRDDDRGVVDSSYKDDVERNKDQEQQLMLKKAQDLINKLGDECKKLIKSQYYENLKYKEIANKYNMKIGTVMSRLSRCWDKLSEIKDA